MAPEAAIASGGNWVGLGADLIVRILEIGYPVRGNTRCHDTRVQASLMTVYSLKGFMP